MSTAIVHSAVDGLFEEHALQSTYRPLFFVKWKRRLRCYILTTGYFTLKHIWYASSEILKKNPVVANICPWRSPGPLKKQCLHRTSASIEIGTSVHISPRTRGATWRWSTPYVYKCHSFLQVRHRGHWSKRQLLILCGENTFSIRHRTYIELRAQSCLNRTRIWDTRTTGKLTWAHISAECFGSVSKDSPKHISSSFDFQSSSYDMQFQTAFSVFYGRSYNALGPSRALSFFVDTFFHTQLPFDTQFSFS